MFRSRYLLNLPAETNDDYSAQDLGLEVHDALHRMHDALGACTLARTVDLFPGSVLAGDSATMNGYLARHHPLCPEVELNGQHEVTVARLYRDGPRPFMLTGRIDAIWKHHGYLDVRDYKTGRLKVENTGDDWTARIQAWLLEPMAAAEGLSLRIQHEYLAAEIDQQPGAYQPEAEDLSEIGLEISRIANEIFESEYQGTSEASVCGWCQYSSACPDSALLDDETIISLSPPSN